MGVGEENPEAPWAPRLMDWPQRASQLLMQTAHQATRAGWGNTGRCTPFCQSHQWPLMGTTKGGGRLGMGRDQRGHWDLKGLFVVSQGHWRSLPPALCHHFK